MAELASLVEIRAGEKRAINLKLTDAAGVRLEDLSDGMLTWGLGPADGSAATVLKTSADPTQIEILDDDPDYEAIVYILPEDTVDFVGAVYRQEVSLVDEDGAGEVLLSGPFVVQPSSTLPPPE